MQPRTQVTWLHFCNQGPQGIIASPSALYQALGGGLQHYTDEVKRLVERHYLIPTGEQRQYRGRVLYGYRVCQAEEYPAVIPFPPR